MTLLESELKADLERVEQERDTLRKTLNKIVTICNESQS